MFPLGLCSVLDLTTIYVSLGHRDFWLCFLWLLDICFMFYLSLLLYVSLTVIALFFTLIFRPFSQPCHLHIRSLLSHFSCYHCFPPCIHVIALLSNPQFSRTLMTQQLYPLSYSSFTLSHSMNWGPDRFLWDFWWLYTNYRFQREVSGPLFTQTLPRLLSSQ